MILFYALQLYFDFSGYCDMAVGIGRMLGVEIPVNFNSPYKAVNIVDFWKRCCRAFPAVAHIYDTLVISAPYTLLPKSGEHIQRSMKHSPYDKMNSCPMPETEKTRRSGWRV